MLAWDAIVLAGGRSSRLGGTQKASLEVGGTTLLGHALRAVSGARQTVVVGAVDVPGATVVCEDPPFGGPAAAVGAALPHLTSAYVLLVGCDQPFVAEAVDVLVEGAGGDGAVAVDAAGVRQPLLSVLRVEALRESARSLGDLDGQSLHVLLRPLDLREVAVHPRATMDVDTWDDHRRAVDEAATTNPTLRERHTMTEALLGDWVVEVAAALGVPVEGVDVDEVLDLAAAAAHSVVRPAAPLTTFLAGLAAGRAGGTPDDIRAAVTAATAACGQHQGEA